MAGSCKRALQTLISIYYSSWRFQSARVESAARDCLSRRERDSSRSRVNRGSSRALMLTANERVFSPRRIIWWSSSRSLHFDRSTVLDDCYSPPREDKMIIRRDVALCGFSADRVRRERAAMFRGTMHFGELCGQLCGPRKRIGVVHARP